MTEENKEKLLDLLADEALFGLSEAEAAELERLKLEFPEFRDDRSFALAAAAINLTNVNAAAAQEALPAHLQAKILQEAEKFFASPAETEQTAPAFEPDEKTKAIERGEREIVETTPSSASWWWGWLGWGVAAAACLALAINLWVTRGGAVQTSPVVQNPPAVQTPAPLSPAQEREQFVASAPDLVQTPWTEPDPKTAKQITGDIVWSDAEQKGFLRFRNLPVNDPSRETYQLWIFDENQSDKTPVDGGVFDAATATSNGEIVVPIDAKIKVEKPKMFAVTMEKPGGVVVSDRKRLVTIAKV